MRDDEAIDQDSPIDIEAVVAHRSFVRKLARTLLLDEHRVDDVVQETWLAALQIGPRRIRSMRNWLATVVRRNAFKSNRSERRREQRERIVSRPEAEEEASAELLDLDAVRRIVGETVLALEEPYRSTILLRFFDNLSSREIARRYGVSFETIKTRTRRGLAILRRRLEERHVDRRALCLALLALTRTEPAVDDITQSPLSADAATARAARVPARAMAVACSFGLLLTIALAIGFWSTAEEPIVLARAPLLAEAQLASEALPSSAEAASNRRPLRDPRASVPSHGALLVRVSWSEPDQPAIGVGVRAFHTQSDDYHLSFQDAVTDAEGIARFPSLRSGDVLVMLDRGKTVAVVVQEGRETTARIRIPDGCLIDGLVRTVSGDPVAGADIFLSWMNPSRFNKERGMRVARSGPDGRFRIRSVLEECALTAFAPGLAAASCLFRARHGAHAEVQIILSGRGRTITGSVVDAAGRPVPDAWVRAGAHEGGVPVLSVDGVEIGYFSPQPLTKTDALGRYVVEGLSEGPVRVIARGQRLPASSESISLGESSHAELTMVLRPGFTLTGTVRSAQTKAALEGTCVLVDTGDGLSSFTTQTGPDGGFELVGLPAGEEVEVRVVARNNRISSSSRVRGEPGETVRRDFSIAKESTIRGRIVDPEGRPIANATVKVVSPNDERLWGQGRADAGGAFEATVAGSAATVRVVDTATDYPLAESNGVRPGEEVVIKVSPERKPSVFITGHVLDAEGRPAGGITMCAKSWTLGRSRDVSSEHGTGRFRLGPYPPGRYQVAAFTQAQGHVLSEIRQLEAGETWSVGSIRLQRPGTLRLSIDCPDEELLKGLLVPLFNEEDIFIQYLPYDPHSTRSPTAFTPGRYRAVINATGAVTRTIPFEVCSGAESRLDVRMRPGLPVRIVLTWGKQTEPEQVYVRVDSAAGDRILGVRLMPSTTRTWQVPIGVEPGTYRVTVSAESAHAERSFEVFDGQLSPPPVFLKLQ